MGICLLCQKKITNDFCPTCGLLMFFDMEATLMCGGVTKMVDVEARDVRIGIRGRESTGKRQVKSVARSQLFGILGAMRDASVDMRKMDEIIYVNRAKNVKYPAVVGPYTGGLQFDYDDKKYVLFLSQPGYALALKRTLGKTIE